MSFVSTDTVAVSVTDQVATVTLNRSEAMNALDLATKESLLTALRAVADDPQVRAVVLTGSGRAFCVGQDLNELKDGLAADADGFWDTVRDHYSPVVTLIATMPKPVVAALNGVAAGAGAAFAFAADHRIASTKASINLAFAGIGLSADSGATWTLPRLVGVARAKQLLLRPRTVGAAECLELGLVDEVVNPEGLHAAATDLAREFASGPTQAYAAIREALVWSGSHDLADSLAHEEELMRRTGTTTDHRQAVEAFLDKRRPEFTGLS